MWAKGGNSGQEMGWYYVLWANIPFAHKILTCQLPNNVSKFEIVFYSTKNTIFYSIIMIFVWLSIMTGGTVINNNSKNSDVFKRGLNKKFQQILSMKINITVPTLHEIVLSTLHQLFLFVPNFVDDQFLLRKDTKVVLWESTPEVESIAEETFSNVWSLHIKKCYFTFHILISVLWLMYFNPILIKHVKN